MVEIVAMPCGDLRNGSQSSLSTQKPGSAHAVADRPRLTPILSAAGVIPLIFASTSGEMRPGPGVCVMKWWMRERDQLIEQTMAFVEGVAAAKPARAAAAASARAEPAKPFRLAGAAESPKPERAAPIELAPMASERAEIQRRVANFKAQQQKFQRAREAHYDAIFSKARATAGNPTRP
jgi:hypothetical protein